MTVRFRIRTAEGQELSFASHEMFEEFVRSGDLAPEDLVYDGETGEWAPARTHPLILEIEYENEEASAAEVEVAAEDPAPSEPKTLEDFGLSLSEPTDSVNEAVSPSGATAPPAEGDEAGLDLGLALALPAEGLSVEDEKRAFVQKMEAERASTFDFGATAPSMQGFKMEDSSVFAEMAKADPEPEPEPEPAPERERVPERRERPAQIKVARPRRKKGGAGKKLALFVVILGLLGVGGYFGMGFMQTTELAEPIDDPPVIDPEPEPEPDPPEPEPVIASTEESVRARAQERFLSRTQALLAGLEPIPEVWLQGDYFLLPSEHAPIRDVWQGYRATIREVRAEDRSRYRLAYEQALDDAGVQASEERSTRLAVATADFALKVEDIDAHWDRVEALALAAVQSHDALLGAEGLVLYDATGTTGRSGGIGAGTSGRDSDSQLLLDQVIDLLERGLDSDGMGPREGANVREWVWGGFLDVITR